MRRMAHAVGLTIAAVGGNPIIVCKEQWSCRGSVCSIQLEKLMHNVAGCVKALLGELQVSEAVYVSQMLLEA